MTYAAHQTRVAQGRGIASRNSIWTILLLAARHAALLVLLRHRAMTCRRKTGDRWLELEKTLYMADGEKQSETATWTGQRD